jgi:hypothetical protein
VFPTPRHSHSADYDSKLKRLFIFGGYSDSKPNFLNQLCILELRNFPTIVFEKIRSLDITSRCRHTSFINSRKLYIYGGLGIEPTTKQICILNDFHYLDIDSGIIYQVTSKGGYEMSGKIFKSCKLEKDLEYAFFCEDLSKFFIFNIDTETFTRVEIKFLIPSRREFYTLNLLSDGRVVLLGGSYKDEGYKDIYYLINYSVDKEISWVYSRLDCFGAVQGEMNGHCTMVLSNDQILIHGGTLRSFNPFEPEEIKHPPEFSSRFQILNLFSSYEWKKESLVFNEGSILHIQAYIPKQNESHPKFLIHGGERGNTILCRAYLYDLSFGLDDNERLSSISEEDFVPQLKGHAWAPLLVSLSRIKQYFILITGGLTISHSDNCEVSVLRRKGEKVTNKMKEVCGCSGEDMNPHVYLFVDDAFSLVHPKAKDIKEMETLKRYGHSMVYMEDQGCIYLLCGFIQYSGYVLEIVKLKLIKEESIYSKRKLGGEVPHSGLTCEIENIMAENIQLEEISGRVHAGVSSAHNCIIIYGGYKNNKVLNDLYVINMNFKKLTVTKVNYEPSFILPRFGITANVHLDDYNHNLSRLIIFGGSFFHGSKMVKTMTSEVIVFRLNFNANDYSLNVEPFTPAIFGFSDKKVYHSACFYENKLYIYGGMVTEFQILELPSESDFFIENCINDYEIYSKKLFIIASKVTYSDWEKGGILKQSHYNNLSKSINKSKHENQIQNSKINSSNRQINNNKISNVSQSSLKTKDNIEVSPIIKPFNIELSETKSQRSNDKLLYEASPQEEKSINSAKEHNTINTINTSVFLSTTQNFTQEAKPLIDKKVNFIFDESIGNLKKPKLPINSQSLLFSNSPQKATLLNSSKEQTNVRTDQEEDSAIISSKGISRKKEKKKNVASKNWDQDYS